MFRLIAILSFALIVETVNGIARCPFPGSTLAGRSLFVSETPVNSTFDH